MAVAWLSGFGDEIDPSLDVQLDVMHGLGIHAIELRGVDGRNISQYSPKEAKAMHTRLHDRGFVVSALGSPFGKSPVSDPFEPVLDSFRNLVDVAFALKSNGIRLFSFYVPQGELPQYRDEVMMRLNKLKDAAYGSGVRLLHENERGIFGELAEQNADLGRTLFDDSFALIFDPSNYVQAGEDAFACWQTVKPWVRYLHMKDSVKTLPKNHDSNPHRIVGDGHGSLKEIVADIAGTDYTGYFSLEPHLKNSGHIVGDPAQQWTAAATGLKVLLREAGIPIAEPPGR